MTGNNRLKQFDTEVKNISECTLTLAFHLIQPVKDSLASWLSASVHENGEKQETRNCGEFQRYHY